MDFRPGIQVHAMIGDLHGQHVLVGLPCRGLDSGGHSEGGMNGDVEHSAEPANPGLRIIVVIELVAEKHVELLPTGPGGSDVDGNVHGAARCDPAIHEGKPHQRSAGTEAV